MPSLLSKVAAPSPAVSPALEFPSWPCFGEEEIGAAVQVLKSGLVNYWTGAEGRLFEQEYAKAAGTGYAVAVANGTVALELALYAAGIGPGDEVITTSRTFIASASAVVMRGAIPVLADVDPDSQNLTAETIRRQLTSRTRAIIAVHLAGWPCDMDAILDLARAHGLKVIEDCAQAHGATYKGRPVGSLGDVAAFSFCQDKIITTGGEGGMLTTNDAGIWERAWAYKDHGKNYRAVYHQQHATGFRWLHDSFGTNWRMTEMQAAIGRVALRKLPDWVAARRRHAAVLDQGLGEVAALRIPKPPDEIGHAYYKYYAFLRPEKFRQGWNRERILAAINGAGIPCFSGSCSEIYLEKAFSQQFLGPPARLPVARELGETSLMFLVHPTLTCDVLEQACATVRCILQTAGGDA
ncbi:MAG: DegT/DnrJ/EryC1/StrS aminotransferase family protein [Desulfuromonadales bacterium]|nr:DegT/DnrJ/EryC1/StrS aminotransferase family protein [Desulfuromonadales bacterium]